VLSDASALTGAVGQDFIGNQTAAVGGFAPPDAVVWALGVALLMEIQRAEQNETGRKHGQQRQLQTVDEACLHGGNDVNPSIRSNL
jgi:hypothetical protein